MHAHAPSLYLTLTDRIRRAFCVSMLARPVWRSSEVRLVNTNRAALTAFVPAHPYVPAKPGISPARRTPSCPTASGVLLSVFVVSLAALRLLTGMTA